MTHAFGLVLVLVLADWLTRQEPVVVCEPTHGRKRVTG